MPPMLDRGHHLCLRGAVAAELVGDHHTRHAGLALQQLPEQALGGPLVATPLHQDVEHEPVLIDGAPEPVLLTSNLHLDLVQMPLVSRVWQLAADLVGEGLAELARPLPDSLMAHGDAASRE